MSFSVAFWRTWYDKSTSDV